MAVLENSELLHLARGNQSVDERLLLAFPDSNKIFCGIGSIKVALDRRVWS